MALFGKIFKKEEQQNEPQLEEFTELPLDLEQKQEHLKIMIEKLDDFTDTDRIIRKVRGGAIVIVGIKGIKERSMDELKHAISKFKTAVSVANGDIVGVGDEFVVLTPSTARIHRGE
ncbi:MAG: cell division protein SepF [Candidatus Aenigmarchaeota archaeon]|nr:cell division protein SepF [Candidatus Aenigmarchaeota archaeon]